MMSLNFSILLIFSSNSSPENTMANFRHIPISSLNIRTWSQYNITLLIFTIVNSNNITTNWFNFTSVWSYLGISFITFEIISIKSSSSLLPIWDTITISIISIDAVIIVSIPWVSVSFYPIWMEDIAFAYSNSSVFIGSSKGVLESSKSCSINFFSIIIKIIFSL